MGIALLIALAERLYGKALLFTVYLIGTTQEETTCQGAWVAMCGCARLRLFHRRHGQHSFLLGAFDSGFPAAVKLLQQTVSATAQPTPTTQKGDSPAISQG